MVAVFLDSCWWHGCEEHASWPKRNGEWWRTKIERNRVRDEDTNRRLAEAGWAVVRVWEHEDPEIAASRVAEVVAGPGYQPGSDASEASSDPAIPKLTRASMHDA